MVQKCVVRGCGSTWYPGSHILYHVFPKDIARRKLWLSIVPLKTKYYESARICSLHFNASEYDFTRKRLNQTAVPFYKESFKEVPSSTGELETVFVKVESVYNTGTVVLATQGHALLCKGAGMAWVGSDKSVPSVSAPMVTDTSSDFVTTTSALSSALLKKLSHF